FQNYPEDYEVIAELHQKKQMTLRIAYNLFTQRPGHELEDFVGAIKGVGEGPIEAIIDARNEGGYFRELFDLCARTDTKKI
ncbi:hypothetical protein HZD82_23985, partial [Pantoea agglomerans]|uniref:helix-hairpin-helix domain-containing protein n=1 Tax=Enterobacter agglomerans TaxID=549 RepID=UPI001A8F59BA